MVERVRQQRGKGAVTEAEFASKFTGESEGGSPRKKRSRVVQRDAGVAAASAAVGDGASGRSSLGANLMGNLAAAAVGAADVAARGAKHVAAALKLRNKPIGATRRPRGPPAKRRDTMIASAVANRAKQPGQPVTSLVDVDVMEVDSDPDDDLPAAEGMVDVFCHLLEAVHIGELNLLSAGVEDNFGGIFKRTHTMQLSFIAEGMLEVTEIVGHAPKGRRRSARRKAVAKVLMAGVCVAAAQVERVCFHHGLNAVPPLVALKLTEDLTGFEGDFAHAGEGAKGWLVLRPQRRGFPDFFRDFTARFIAGVKGKVVQTELQDKPALAMLPDYKDGKRINTAVALTTVGRDSTTRQSARISSRAEAEVENPLQPMSAMPPVRDPLVGQVIVLGEDMLRLEGRRWLNDRLVDYYLRFVEYKYLRPYEKAQAAGKTPHWRPLRVFTFNSQFFNLYQEKGYDYVKRWTKKVNVFELDYLVVPIVMENHWTLLVIARPGALIDSSIDLNERGSSNKICTGVLFDSLRAKNQGRLRVCSSAMRSYFVAEHADKKEKLGLPPLAPYVLNAKNDIVGKKGKNSKLGNVFFNGDIPMQRNDSDCGLFVVHLYEKFISWAVREAKVKEDEASPITPQRQAWKKTEVRKGWIDEPIVAAKRQRIREVIMSHRLSTEETAANVASRLDSLPGEDEPLRDASASEAETAESPLAGITLQAVEPRVDEGTVEMGSASTEESAGSNPADVATSESETAVVGESEPMDASESESQQMDAESESEPAIVGESQPVDLLEGDASRVVEPTAAVSTPRKAKIKKGKALKKATPAKKTATPPTKVTKAVRLPSAQCNLRSTKPMAAVSTPMKQDKKKGKARGPGGRKHAQPRWNEMLEGLKAYKRFHGNTRVPLQKRHDKVSCNCTATADHKMLGAWVHNQREGNKRGSAWMTDERRKLLNAVDGWVWEPLEHQWDSMLATLVEFTGTEGHALVRMYEINKKLAVWVKNQRQDYNSGKARMTEERARRLEGVTGWKWSARK